MRDFAYSENNNDGIRLSSEFDDDSLNTSPPSDASLPTVIAQLPAPGIPTAPGNLRAQPHAANSLILRWEPSQIMETAGKQTNKTIQGKESLMILISRRGFLSQFPLFVFFFVCLEQLKCCLPHLLGAEELHVIGFRCICTCMIFSL